MENKSLYEVFSYPYDDEYIIRKQKSLKRKLLARKNVYYIPKRVAILSGSTTDDIKNILELYLLAAGVKPEFYQSEYNKFYEDALFSNEKLDCFQPEIIIVFTSVVNIINWPTINDSSNDVQNKLTEEFSRYQQVWESLRQRFSAVIIQNNFDLPFERDVGSLGSSISWGKYHYIESINAMFAKYAREHENFYINDLNGLSARIGLARWHNHFQYYAYKFAMNYDVMPQVSLSLANIIKALTGKSKKCLVLDLDNTLWGGIIGDDGVDNIKIGHETPTAEAYTAWQAYVLHLKERGVILAVCSKNEDDVAKSGFTHPDSVLHLNDFAAFKANWLPKNENIVSIAQEINIGLDSIVFIDDNPAEREIVRDSLPEVSVPEVDGSDVFSYIKAIEEAGYFDTVAISVDDIKRNDNYQANRARQELARKVASYDDFLQSLQMSAEIDEFQPVYFDRIAQLTGKTNQFNLTTRRYTRIDIERMANDPTYITLYGRLEDKFGDNGLISVIIGEKRDDELHILLWLMSCRVLKRGMEDNMLDALVSKAQAAGCRKLVGYYYPTKKNKMVANMYETFGFVPVGNDGDGVVTEMLIEGYAPKGKYIKLQGEKS